MTFAISKFSVKHFGCVSSSLTFIRALSVDGRNSTAFIYGGLSLSEKQLMKHGQLYTKYNFEAVPIASNLMELMKPDIIDSRAMKFASEIQSLDKPVAIHAISAGFFTMIRTLKAMDKDWRDRNVKSIVFDSCPTDTTADGFAGAISFLLKRDNLKPYIAKLVNPYLYLCGITEERRKEFDLDMFGATSVIPRTSCILFAYDRNDPVINYDYLNSVVVDLKKNKSADASIHELIFEKSRHAFHLNINEEEYTNTHTKSLLEKVEEWKQ